MDLKIIRNGVNTDLQVLEMNNIDFNINITLDFDSISAMAMVPFIKLL